MLRRLLSWFGTREPPLDPLLLQARSSDPDRRRAAAAALSTSTEPWASAALLDLLIDLHTIVRVAARAALVQLGPNAAPILIEGLKHGSPDAGRAAAELLGELRIVAGVEPLLLSLKFGPRPVQIEAKRALIRIGPAALKALQSAQQEPQPWVRHQVVEALAEIRKQNTATDNNQAP